MTRFGEGRHLGNDETLRASRFSFPYSTTIRW
jgi:hypothetical protein